MSLAASLGFIGYSCWRGFRYPPLMYVTKPHSLEYQPNHISLSLTDAILVKTGSPLDRFPTDLKLRAFAPEPIVRLHKHKQTVTRLVINNVHAESSVIISGAELHDHQVSGTNHLLELRRSGKDTSDITVKFAFPWPEAYRFAAIGDTGGDKELYWCLKRMAQVGADFALHLGDFVYQEGDYPQAIEYFYTSSIPCYIAIGNHDFHHKGKIFQPYLDYLGIFSHAFQLGNTRFVNIDSANDFFPPWAGQRGQLVETLASQPTNKEQETLAFSHRPLRDYRAGEDHAINGVFEADWLHRQLLAANTSHFFAGHIHDKHELDHQGLNQVIAGQGLGHQDLLMGKNVSEFVLADISQGKKMDYSWQPLVMPAALHCNSVHLRYLKNKKQFTMLKQANEFSGLCNDLYQHAAN